MKIPFQYISSGTPTLTVVALAGASFSVACAMAAYAFYPKVVETVLSNEGGRPQELAIEAGSITAEAAIVYDPLQKRVLFAKNANSSLPLASLTKLMTAQTVLALEKENPSVTITYEDLAPEGDWGLIPGTSWKLRDLIAFGLVSSSNDAMAAAASAASPRIIDEMNKTASSLGLYQTYFLNPTGLDVDPETAGAYGSAYDVARLASIFLEGYPELFEATAKPSIQIFSDGISLFATSTDTPILDIPGLIAAKTGYTDLAGGNLVAIFDLDIGRPVVVAVLGSTRAERFKDVRTLITAAREQLL